jgi:hypothetical protein
MQIRPATAGMPQLTWQQSQPMAETGRPPRQPRRAGALSGWPSCRIYRWVSLGARLVHRAMTIGTGSRFVEKLRYGAQKRLWCNTRRNPSNRRSGSKP